MVFFLHLIQVKKQEKKSEIKLKSFDKILTGHEIDKMEEKELEKKYNLDFILRFGFGIIRGDIAGHCWGNRLFEVCSKR